MITWTTITSLGDVTIMAAAAAAIALVLLAQRAWRIAFWWCLLLVIGTILVVATKIAYIGWGIGICPLDFKGLSGHAMRATAIIPVACYLIFHGRPAMIRMYGILLGITLGLVVVISRLVLHFHSTSEAVAGAALGIVVSLSMIEMLRAAPRLEFTRPFIAFSLLVVLVAPQVEPIPTQRWMVELGFYLSGRKMPSVQSHWELSSSEHDCNFRTEKAEYSLEKNLFVEL